MNTCKSTLATRAILYTDTINGKQVCRDDMWAVTTEELSAMPYPKQRHLTMMIFYGAISYETLVDAMGRHIKNLQAKLPAPKDEQPKDGYDYRN